MLFDFSWSGRTLRMCFAYEENDHTRYFDSYTTTCSSQLSGSEKIQLWNFRKYVLLHDFITTYISSELAQALACDNAGRSCRVVVEINDRGDICKMDVNPYDHVPEMHCCQASFNCDLLQQIVYNSSPAFLCDRCGILYKTQLHMCTQATPQIQTPQQGTFYTL